MKIKPIYIINIVFLGIIIAVLFTPLKDKLKNIYNNDAQSEFSTIKKLNPEQYSIELEGVNTPSINFSTFKGKKIFMHFWGTWCPVCVEEMPEVQKFYEQNKDSMEFVFIYMNDNKDRVLRYMEKNKYTFPVYEAKSPIETALLPKAFPTTVLIDEEGNVKDKIEGAKDWATFRF